MRESGKTITAYLLITLSYVVSGKLALMLALPPGYASAIFPPAGIAVAAVLIGGRSVLPWVFAGSFLLNFWVGYAAQPHNLALGLGAALIIAAASVAQAAFGGWLLRRVVGCPCAFDNVFETFSFLLLAPLICLVSATLSLAGLSVIGVIDRSDLLIGWGAWWAGDTLGVMVTLPLVLIVAGEPRSLWRSRIKSVALPMLLIFGLLVVMFLKTNQWEREDTLTEFRLASTQAINQIQNKLDEQNTLLLALNNLIIHSPDAEVDRAEFRRFTATLLQRFPMIQGLEWVPRVSAGERDRFVARQRKEISDFEIREQGQDDKLQVAARRSEYYPVTYVEPLEGNQAVLGFDLESNSQRREAIRKSLQSSGGVASEPVRLVQADGQPGLLLLKSVRTNGREIGVVLVVLKMHEFIEKTLPESHKLMNLHFSDEDAHRVLYDGYSGQVRAGEGFTNVFEFGSRHYRLSTSPTRDYLKAHRSWESWGVLAVGTAVTGILGGMLLLGTGFTYRMQRTVADRTFQMQQSERRLRGAYRELEDKTDKLASENEKSQALLRNASDGIHILDDAGNVIEASDSFCAMLGYSRDEVIGMNLAVWDAGFTSHEALMGKLKEQFDSPERALFETRHRCKDGRVIDVEVSGHVLELGGRHVLFNSSRDITERKRVEEEMRESEQRLLEILNLSPIAVRIAADQGRTVMFCNAAYVVLIRNTHAMGDDPRRYYARPEDYDAVLAELAAGEVIINREIELCIPEGGTVWVLASYMPIRYHGMDAVLGWFYDVTERRNYTARLQQSEQEYRHLIEFLPYGALVHRGGNILLTNQVAASLLRASSSSELVGKPVLDFVHPDYRGVVQGRVRAAIDQGENQNVIEEKLVRIDGGVFYAEVAAISVLFEGRPASLAVFMDISGRKRAEDELRLAASVYRNSSEGMMITDAEGRIEAINPAFTQLTGYELADVLGMNPRILKSGMQPAEFYQDMWMQLNTTGQWRGELWNRRKDGQLFAETLSINAEKHANGSVHRYVALFSDITDQKKKEELIWTHANFDTLTGLPNRRLFMDRLDQEMRRVKRSGTKLALLFIDLDHFKEVNDTLGHAKGDNLLIEATRRIRIHVRDTDTLARLGGDEFTLILPEFGELSNIDRVVQNILRELGTPFDLGGGDMGHISGSIGITLYPDDAAVMDELLQHADQTMYAEKAAGRNGFSYFTMSMQVDAQEKLQLTNDLRHALARDELEVLFQPIIEASSGRVTKAEALLRWHHPLRGTVSPATFIPLAEESGLILEIGEWVFLEVIRNIQIWMQQTGKLVQVSVNKSPVQFIRATEHRWQDRLAESGLPAGCITVEITEGLLLNDSVAIRNKLDDFGKRGIEVSIDDFGTGFSALSYLNKFDIDYLKIDRSFVSEMHASKTSRALTEAIISMAHKLGIKAIAEGVETEVQRDLLLKLGCDYLQGYLFSRPVPAADFEKLLRQQEQA